MATTATAAAAKRRRGRYLDPGQREYEPAETIVTLIVAVSRYGTDEKRARSTAQRLFTITEITAVVAGGSRSGSARSTASRPRRPFANGWDEGSHSTPEVARREE